ncbi:protein SPEAR1-like [Zingiber officinale]|uniref:protein SPEAR1-like n=1 Tax=Zingiber officinale TaxID=94328 RepID=UPI001C4C46E1|nr:protein SPEAR1-like [Zingiber officinale]
MLGLGCGRRNESSRKRGKKNNSKRPKQPQRGLGVARLEKIILQNQMRGSYINLIHKDSGSRLQTEHPSSSSSATSSSSTFDPYSSVMIGFGDNAEMSIAYDAFHSLSFLDHAVQPTLSLFEQTTQINEGSISTSHNSCDLQEIDLELRL